MYCAEFLILVGMISFWRYDVGNIILDARNAGTVILFIIYFGDYDVDRC